MHYIDQLTQPRLGGHLPRSLREIQFRWLAEVEPHFVWVIDQDEELQYANQRSQQASSRPFSTPGDASQLEEMVHPANQAEFRKELRQALATGGSFELEARLQLKDGASPWFLIRSVTYSDQEASTLRWHCVTATDIDQHKRLELDLQRLNEDLEQFVHSASHDLREPLRSITIFAELLQRQMTAHLDKPSQTYLNHIRGSAARMAGLLEGLLSYMHGSQAGTSDAVPIDANLCLQHAKANLCQAITESKAEIVSADLPQVAVAPVHLELLFQNLLSNAIKFARRDVAPRIAVAVAPDQGEWIFSVADNGIGIAPEHQDQVFRLFRRLHRKDEYPGSGLGLALCARIVERYKGRTWVESKPMAGSTFYFTLPRMLRA